MVYTIDTCACCTQEQPIAENSFSLIPKGTNLDEGKVEEDVILIGARSIYEDYGYHPPPLRRISNLYNLQMIDGIPHIHDKPAIWDEEKPLLDCFSQWRCPTCKANLAAEPPHYLLERLPSFQHKYNERQVQLHYEDAFGGRIMSISDIIWIYILGLILSILSHNSLRGNRRTGKNRIHRLLADRTPCRHDYVLPQGSQENTPKYL